MAPDYDFSNSDKAAIQSNIYRHIVCKMIISLAIFNIFLKFWFFGFIERKNGKKWSKVTKKICLSRSVSQEPYIIWLSFIRRMCRMIISPKVLSSFSIFVFFGLSGVPSEQKTVQNDKKFCPSRFIAQEPYIIWLSFMVNICKMIISPGTFFNFSKFSFFRLLGG